MTWKIYCFSFRNIAFSVNIHEIHTFMKYKILYQQLWVLEKEYYYSKENTPGKRIDIEDNFSNKHFYAFWVFFSQQHIVSCISQKEMAITIRLVKLQI